MKAREIIRRLQEDGWYLKDQKGSHMQFVHPTKPGKVTVPNHPGADVPNYVLASVWRQAGLK